MSEPSTVELQRRFPVLRVRPLPGLLNRANAAVWLFYGSWLVALAAFGLGIVRSLAGAAGGPELLCAEVMCLLVNRGFLRTPLEGRVEDVLLPVGIATGLLVAFSARSACDARNLASGIARTRLRGFLLTGLPWTGIAITLLASAALGDAIHQFVVLGVLDTRSSVAASARRSVGQLRGGVASFVSSEAVAVAAYLDRCTEPDQRVLVTFFAPEIPYVARRGFAAGHLYFVSAYFSSDEQQRAAVERLARQNVPVALLPQSTYDAEFTVDHSLIAGYLEDRYERRPPLLSGGSIGLYVSKSGRTGTDTETGLPCFRE